MIQLQALNKILAAGDSSLIIMNGLDESFFSDYTEEFKFIKEHLDLYNKVPDLATFINKFNNFDIIGVSEPNSFIIDKLFEDKNKRELAKTFNKVRELLTQDKTQEALDLYTTAANTVSSGTHLQTVDLLTDRSRYDAYIERCNDYGKFYIKTGFTELDNLFGGWDRQEELATIVARSNVGKSWLLLKTATAALEQGLRVGIYSGEMSARKVGYRIDTLLSHISNSGITRGDERVNISYKEYLDSLATRYSGCLKVLTPMMLGGPAGVTALKAFIEKEKLDILCVDQHSLLEDDRHAKNPVEKASNISKDLKNLQVMSGIPIITVSQQNRTKNEEGTVDTTMIAQSDRIGQDSTIVIFFEQKDGIGTLSLVKSRDSVNMKKLHYSIDFDKGIFEYIPEDTSSEDGQDQFTADRIQALIDEYEEGDDIIG